MLYYCIRKTINIYINSDVFTTLDLKVSLPLQPHWEAPEQIEK